MNRDLEQCLHAQGVTVAGLSKQEKVKLLSRWTKEFPELMRSARDGRRTPNVAQDAEADCLYSNLRNEEFYVLPDDASGMTSFLCKSDAMPDPRELVSDTITKCEELVFFECDFKWSAVFTNHGAPQLVGRYFQDRRDDG